VTALRALAFLLLLWVPFAPAPAPAPATFAAAAEPERWCDLLPRPAYRDLERVKVPGDWFQVYRVEEGVFALYEPLQFQEVLSYLILGSQSALLFDTGLGIGKIAEVVKSLTPLPVSVLNSHTHFDHVGGNEDFSDKPCATAPGSSELFGTPFGRCLEFDGILAMDTAFTRANTRGFPHATVAGEVASTALCAGLPPGVTAATYRTRPWHPSEYIRDGHRIDLGGRKLEVLHVPGHTPDAIALLDRERGLLFTGDTFYEGPIWLYAPETDLAAFARSVDRLAALTPTLRKLLPAHNVPVSDPKRLIELREAVRRVRSGEATLVDAGNGQIEFPFEGFSILTSKRALLGKPGDPNRGGSGLDVPADPEP
jgi:glyoxylase-like metal-dependent hydrolase (beta-lactamase superfamily II)